MLTVRDFLEKYSHSLNLELLAGKDGLSRKIKLPETERPGLSLTGYLKGYTDKRILVFGRVEIEYLKHLDSETRIDRLKGILSKNVPAVIIARKFKAPRELEEICERENIPLLRTKLVTMQFLNQLTVILSEEFSPSISCHGTLVEAFGLGVLIQGDSSVGKSETALGMIERGHRLVSDDIVIVKKKEGSYLEGTGPELTRHLLEIRGIGIINVAHLYGAVCISEAMDVDLIVKLEEWDDQHFYDRIGLEEKYCDLLGIKVPFYIMPVKPGRDVVLLLETIVLNHRLKGMGYNSAKEFNVKLLETISKRQRMGKKELKAAMQRS
ncbi:MAG: HPr(Ser) kinase/phosphatase [Rhabdochlamydiaceae bacterium]|nr:HPr(Ser) kinase/phosphatase [Candidatus Amphrikana amoebophyrae]